LATLHGLVLAHATPLKILTAPQAVAYAINQPTFHVALNAGKGEIFVQSFAGTTPTSDIRLVKPDAIATLADCYGNSLPPNHPHYQSGPQAAVLCRIAPQLPFATLEEAMPLYIRPPDAKISAPPPWLIPSS
jgi:tRNA A37 threonylcarbamoyladenosine modification protein TsaB